MKRGKKLLSVFVATFMVFSFAACGKENPASEKPESVEFDLGNYKIVYKDACIMEDYDGNDALVMTLDYTNNSGSSDSYLWSISENVMQNDVSLEFATIYLDESSFETVCDSQFTEVQNGETIEVKTAFILADTTSMVEVSFEESFGDATGKVITIDPSKLSRETPKAPATKTTEKAATADSGDALLDFWNGDWYGWWVMTGCYGNYEGMGSMSWDICGTIDIGDDYTGTVVLWDEDYTRNDPMVEASVTLSEFGTGEYGTLMSESGDFTDIALEHADWIVDPGLVDFPPGMIIIDGYYENGDDEYYYEIHLLPWGSSWDDLGEDFLPYYYYDWYLPLIEAGKAMPDSINVGA